MMYHIRTAKSSDKEAVIELMRQFYVYSGASLDVDYAYGEFLFTRHLKPDSIIICLIFKDLPVGILMGNIAPGRLGKSLVAHESMWWVTKDHRGSPKAIKMIEVFEQWAHDHGCNQVHMVSLAYTSAVGRLYKHLGFKPVEIHYTKDLNTGGRVGV